MSDPFGIMVSSTTENLGVDAACIWFETVWHLNLISLIFEINGEFADLLIEAIAVLSELQDGDAVENFMVVDGGDETEGHGMDGIIEVLLGHQCCEGCLG